MCWIVWLVLGVLVVLSGCSGSPDTAVDSTTGSTAVSSSSTIRESTTTTTATASTTTTAPATTTTTTLIATTTTLLSPTSATTRTTTATADPADPDKLSAESFSELIGLEWKPVRDPEAVLDSWIWRVLDVSVEPPHLSPFWSLGGWVVDFAEAEQHWVVEVFTANDPGLDSPTLGPHFIVLDQAIGHDESGIPVWRIHDVRVVPEIATNGWIQQCYERSGYPDTADRWSVAAYVAGEPVVGEYGLEIAARDAWRIDIDAGHFESIDTESIICVHEVE
jgi:hypothetical protein